jgi:hypothetical protein
MAKQVLLFTTFTPAIEHSQLPNYDGHLESKERFAIKNSY